VLLPVDPGWCSVTSRGRVRWSKAQGGSARRLFGLALFAVTISAGAAIPTPAAAEVPDASCPGPRQSSQSTDYVEGFEQTFTAEHTGLLSTAQVDVTKVGNPGDFIVEVYIDTVPFQLLDGAIVPDADVPDGNSIITVHFSSFARVYAGEPLFLYLARGGSAAHTEVGVRTGDACPGRLSLGLVPLDSQYDMVFNTFVIPDEAPAADVVAPETWISRHPKRKTSSRRAVFEFDTNELDAGTECQLDGGRFDSCRSPTFLKVSRGRHTFRVRGVDAANNVDPTPAGYDWRVTKKRKK
jgi:hypothetical protein